MGPAQAVAGNREATVEDLGTVDRQQQALELYLSGMTYDQVAKTVGYHNKGSAQRAVANLLKRVDHSLATEYRDRQNARLERSMLAIWPKVLKGDLQAVDRVIRLSERQSKLLGLDAPQGFLVAVAEAEKRVDEETGQSVVGMAMDAERFMALVAEVERNAAVGGDDDDVIDGTLAEPTRLTYTEADGDGAAGAATA